jgi:DNA mismatch endonuclease (patch repair protein)
LLEVFDHLVQNKRFRSSYSSVTDYLFRNIDPIWREQTLIVPVTDELRSRIMRGNKSCGNLSTELALIDLMRSARISGWRRHVSLAGRPDFVFKRERIAVFVDGCYWHGCRCRRLPTEKRQYWEEKFQANQARDKRVTRELRAQGWTVVRLWEHQLKKHPRMVIKRISEVLHLSLKGAYDCQQKDPKEN